MATHNVYLPDELSERAKAAGISLSPLLRRAVMKELDQMEALAQVDVDVHTLPVLDLETNQSYSVRFTGEEIASWSYGTTQHRLFLTSDGRLLEWEDGNPSISGNLLADPLFTVHWFSGADPETMITIANRLGITDLVIDI